MTKNRIVLILLAMLMIGAVIYNIKKLSKKTGERPPVSISKPKAVPENAKFTGNTEFATLYLKRESLTDGWDRNPFYLPDEGIPQQPAEKTVPLQKQQPPDLKLELVLTMDNQRVAILSGQFVKEGDQIGDEVVVKIESDMVILKKNVTQRTIKLDSFYNPFQIVKRR